MCVQAQMHSDTSFWQVVLVMQTALSLIDWISDTRSQAYTALQSLVKCLEHSNSVSDACKQRF